MTKKTLFFKFSILVLATIVFALTLHGISHALTFTHIYVDAVNGTNAPTGRGSAAKPYQSITFALLLSARNNLPDPWHVHIRPGTYDADLAKPVNVREIFPLKLRREMIFEGTTTAEECVIDGQHTGAALVPILHGEDTEGVTIRNLTIQNSLRTNSFGGIILHDPTGTKETPSTLEGCIVHNNKGGGVWSSMPLILTGNTFSSNGGAGVRINRSTAATNNIFSDNATGLFIDGDSTGDISENTFQNNSYSGLYVKGTLKANVAHNTFNNNTSYDGGGFFANAFTGDVTHNAFNNNNSRNSGGGFYANAFTGDVTHNTFNNNNARRYGGGGFYTRTFTGDVTHNIFNNNNSRNSGGGGFYTNAFTGDVTHNTFTRNTNNGTGGGLRVDIFTGNVTHNIFDSNSSGKGGGFHLGKSTTKNTVEVFNNIFFNNTARGTGNAVTTGHATQGHATHFMNNLFMISDELSEGVSGAHTIWVNSPQCRFHNNIFSGVKTAIYTEGTFDLPITHNLFHDVKVDFVEQAGNNLGNDLLFWELVAVNATNNLEGAPLLVDPVTLRDFHLQAASPAINAGTNQFAPSDDFDGVARPVGKTVDIGPYEYGGKPASMDDSVNGDTTDDNRTPQTLEIVSGVDQQGSINTALANPFVVEVRDGSGSTLAGVAVKFAVTAGGGMLSIESATTDADGRAESTLTLGNNAGTNSVSVSVAGISQTVTFNAVGKIRAESTVRLFSPTIAPVNVGETFTINLMVEGVTDLAGWQLDAAFNRVVLSAVSVNEGDFLKGEGRAETTFFQAGEIDNGAGSISDVSVARVGADGVSGAGTLFSITFEAKEVGNGLLQLRSVKLGSTDGAVIPHEIVIHPVMVEDHSPAWDVNGDGDVNIFDLILVSQNFGQTNPETDINGDGAINIFDLILVAQHFGEGANPAAPGVGRRNFLSVVGNTHRYSLQIRPRINSEAIRKWVNMAHAADDGSHGFRVGIANLESLLAAMIPDKSALFPNYPNPFNPETWIPYHLANDADVQITIYDAKGGLVRRLDPGHQRAGYYTDRNRAAYWDGLNANGELVSSGVYFYTITAGDFAATKRLVIVK